MSLIMEALKKAQQMRSGASPGISNLEGVLARRSSFPANRKKWWGLGAIIVTGGVITFLIFGNYFSTWPLKKESKVPKAEMFQVKTTEEDKPNLTPSAQEQKPRSSSNFSPSPKEPAKVDRPLLPLTLVALQEPTRPIESPVAKEVSEKKPAEEINEQAAGAKLKATKGEKIEINRPQEESLGGSPAPEIKIEKIASERQSAKEGMKYFNAAVQFYQQRHLLQAIEAYKNALHLNPHFLEAYNNLALIYQEMGDLEKARETLEKAREIDPNYEKAWHNLGIVLLLQNRYEEAIEVFQKTLLLNPRSVESHLNLGVLYKKKGDLSKALECYQQALKINPLRGEVHYNLALIYEEANNLTEAIRHYRSFLHLAGKDYPGLAAEVGQHINRLGKELKGR